MAIILTRDGVQIKGAGNVTDISAENKKIVNVANPTNPQDVATKDYVDNSSGAASYALDGTFTIRNTVDDTKRIDFDASAITASTTRTLIMPDADVNLGLVASAIQSSEKGANNGVATLDAGGKVPLSQLPSSIMTYEGVWNASTNTPALADGVGDAGMVYIVNVAGTQNLGSGNITFNVGDWAIYNGTIWEKSENSNAVVSVNGQTGVVVLNSSHLNHTQAAPANWTVSDGSSIAAHLDEAASRLAAIEAWDSDDIPEGSTNEYFTEAKVRSTPLTGLGAGSDTAITASDTVLSASEKLQAQITAAKSSASSANTAISDHLADTTDAHDASAISNVPSGNLAATDVQAALNELQSDVDSRALDSDLTNHLNDTTDAHDASAISVSAITNLTATDVQAALAEHQSDIDGLVSDSGRMFEMGVAGEAMAANQVWLVRRAKNGETSGRYYKAQANSFVNSNVVGLIIVGASAVSAGDSVRVYKLGSAQLGSADTGLGAANIGLPLYLHQTTAGKFTISPTSTTGDILKLVGYVAEDLVIEFQPQMAVQA